MRLGLISDIHGNLFALDAVLAELDRAGVDQIACLGDLAVLGPEPAGVIDRVMERGMPTVRGNVDDWLAPGEEARAQPPDSAQTIGLTAWTIAQLQDRHLDFLNRLPMSLSFPLGDGWTMSCFHAAPTSLDDITHASAPWGVGESRGADIMCCGHTHVQEMWRVDEQLWINPGSVGMPGVGPGTRGLPQNRDVAWAEYAMIDAHGGRSSVAMHRLELDVATMWAAVQRTDMPHQAWWRSRWKV